MGTVTRPTKLGGGTDVLAGNDILASEWNGDINAIVNDHNGNITDVNVAAAAAIDGTKLKDTSITTIKIGNGQVTKAKIGAAEITADKLKATGTNPYTNGAPISLSTVTISGTPAYNHGVHDTGVANTKIPIAVWASGAAGTIVMGLINRAGTWQVSIFTTIGVGVGTGELHFYFIDPS
jgi:hypothetical protein